MAGRRHHTGVCDSTHLRGDDYRMTHPTSGAFLRDYAQTVEAAHPDLTRLDRLADDGDFGDNLRAGLRAVITRLDAAHAEPGLDIAASVFLDDVGGTSGPLFGLLFTELAAAAKTHADPVAAWRAGLTAGLAAIQRVGEAQPGDRTLVDALAPAADALAAPNATLTDAARAAIHGARATATLRARRGRASYVGDHAYGVPDPGAAGIALLLRAAAASLDPAASHTLDAPSKITAADVSTA
jgi:phosphoenolpyruvate---glycerone phosphotransferase subunit DhaL